MFYRDFIDISKSGNMSQISRSRNPSQISRFPNLYTNLEIWKSGTWLNICRKNYVENYKFFYIKLLIFIYNFKEKN